MSYFKSIIQDVKADDNNSSTDNILFGETWSGTSTSTLGVVGLQFSLKTDQNMTVCVEQSPDGTNWDLTDEYDYISSKGGDGWTTQAINSYMRVLVTNVGFTGTTYFRAQTALCPIAEPLPRSLSDDGRLKSECHISDQNDRHVRISRQSELLTTPVYRMVGTSFNTYYDTNFWLTGGTNGGTVSFDGDAQLSSSIASGGTATLNSVRKARFVTGSANLYRGALRLTTLPTSGCTRRTGAYNDDNGFYLQLSGETLGIGSRKGGVDTVVSSGSFNGDFGSTVDLSETVGTNAFGLKIEYGIQSVDYYVGDTLLHKIPLVDDSFVETLTLPLRTEVINQGSTANNGIIIFAKSLFRIGELKTNPTWKYFEGNQAEVCKYSSGTIHSLIIQDSSGNAAIYDGIDDTGTLIADVDLATGTLVFDLSFNNGLYIETTNGANVTVTYE